MKDIAMQLIEKNAEPFKEGNGDEAWVIIYKGNRMKLSNGKSVWRKRNHASSALSNQIKWAFECQHRRRTGSDSKWHEAEKCYKRTMLELQDEGILEFRRIR